MNCLRLRSMNTAAGAVTPRSRCFLGKKTSENFKIKNIILKFHLLYTQALKAVQKESYRKKMNQMKCERKGKAPYTKKVNIPLGRCVHSTLVFRYVLDARKMQRGKDCEKIYRTYQSYGKAVIYTISTVTFENLLMCLNRVCSSKKV